MATTDHATDLGFTTKAYHGTAAAFEAFDINMGKCSTISGYAPHFTDSRAEAAGYARERKTKGKRSTVMNCLLRIKKPLEISFSRTYSPAEFKRIVGRAGEEGRMTGYDILRELSTVYGYERDRYEDTREMWRIIYARLTKLGYDAIVYPETLPDHSNARYTKIVMLDPKNIRIIDKG